MKNNNRDLFDKGYFQKIDRDFIAEGVEALEQLSKVQSKYNKTDTDTFINELRDSIIGEIMGYHEVNLYKHGFDCKSNKGDFLEVKNASFSAKTWQATFNDTTYEKAEAFKSDRLYLALAIWDKAAELLFIVYGKNREIGEYLESKIDTFKNGDTVRSTQSIPFTTLINKYGFKIINKDKSKSEVVEIIRKKYKGFGKLINENDIYLSNEFFN